MVSRAVSHLRTGPGLNLILGNLAATAFVIEVAWARGSTSAFFLVVLLIAAVGGLTRPRALSILLLALAPLPSVEQLLGVSPHAGLDAVNLLVFLALGIAVIKGTRFPLRGEHAVIAFAALNFALLAIAWYRIFGSQAANLQSAALLLHPAVVFVAGVLVVQLLEPEKAPATVAIGIAVMLFIVGLSVFAQAIGIYTPPGYGVGVKANGGLMGQGNDAAALFSTFAVPAFILLRSVGRSRLGAALVIFSFPVILVTGARASLVIFPLTLLALASFDRRVQTTRAVALVVVLCAVYIGTVGRSQTQHIVQSVTQHSLSSNETLSGRPYIWGHAIQFLNQDDHWLIGGGLNAFQSFIALDAGSGGFGFATHNTWLKQLTDGGLIMAAGYFLFLISLWRLSQRGKSQWAIALRVALVGTVLLGLSTDLDPFDRRGAWLWALAALSALPDRARATHEPAGPDAHERPQAPPSTPPLTPGQPSAPISVHRIDIPS